MWKMISGQSPAEGEMGAAFANALVKIMNTNRRIVAMDADLADASRFSIIKKKVPGQFIEMGIAEANMIGDMAGSGSSRSISQKPVPGACGCI